MAKLTITRPRLHWREYAPQSDLVPGYRTPIWACPIEVDGRRVGSVGAGETIEVELLPGPHQVRAGTRFFGSQALDIDATVEATRRFALGPGSRWQKLLVLVAVFLGLSMLPQLGVMVWLLAHKAQRMLGAVDSGWFSAIYPPLLGLPILGTLLVVTLMSFSPKQGLDLVEISGRDLTESQLAELFQSRSVRMRISIRESMIAVAVLAVFFAAVTLWTRHERSNHFRRKAKLHANLEDIVRNPSRTHFALQSTLKRRALMRAAFANARQRPVRKLNITT